MNSSASIEQPKPQPNQANLPSGISRAEQLIPEHVVDASVLPWLENPYSFSIARCELSDGTTFLLGSVMNSHKRLTEAANAMTEHQKAITDNMFYSRLAGFMQSGQSSSVETMPKPATPFPIHVMRNRGGQRVYFGLPQLELNPGQGPQPVVLRLAVCDKNKQGLVFKVLSSAETSEVRHKMGRSK